MLKQFLNFCIRWFSNCLSLVLITFVPGGLVMLEPGFTPVFLAGGMITLLNAFLRPVLALVFLPLALVTLGLFSVLLNTLMVLVVAQFYDGLVLKNWVWAFAIGVLIGLINYLITKILHKD